MVGLSTVKIGKPGQTRPGQARPGPRTVSAFARRYGVQSALLDVPRGSDIHAAVSERLARGQLADALWQLADAATLPGFSDDQVESLRQLGKYGGTKFCDVGNFAIDEYARAVLMPQRRPRGPIPLGTVVSQLSVRRLFYFYFLCATTRSDSLLRSASRIL